MKVEQKYLNYILKSNNFKNYIAGCAQGSASQASITLEDIKRYKIFLPEIKYQEYISGVLDCIDKKIELNYQIIDNLQKLINNLYIKYFVNSSSFI